MIVHVQVLKHIIAGLEASKKHRNMLHQAVRLYVNQDGLLTIESYCGYYAIRKRVPKKLVEDLLENTFISIDSLGFLKAALKASKKNNSMVELTPYVTHSVEGWPEIDNVWPKFNDKTQVVSFNVHYLEKLLEALKEHNRQECVELHFTDNNSPLLITLPNSDGAAVLMPAKTERKPGTEGA